MSLGKMGTRGGFGSQGALGGASSPGIRLSASTFGAGSVQGSAIGTLSVAGATGTPTFTLTDSHTNAVQVSGTSLQAGSAVSSAGSFSITVHVTGVTPALPDKTFLITAINKTLSANSGSFVLTGDTLSSAYSFGLDQGSFVLTGEAVSLLGANTLAANEGVFALTGNTAVLGVTMAAAEGSFTLTGEAATLTAPSSYTGPGDINGAAAIWVGLRGFSAAYATGSNPCCDLVDQAGANALIGVVIKSDGTLDVASINAWVTAHSVTTIKCSKLNDQSGNGVHLTQATLANMPTLNLTGIGGSKPALVFNGSQTLLSSATVTCGSTFTFAVVAERTSGSAFVCAFGGGGNTGIWFDGTNQPSFFAGSVVHNSGLENVFHRHQVFFNGASTTSFIDNAAGTAASPGTGGISGNVMGMGATGSGGFNLTGAVVEGAIWSGDQSANYASIDLNQKTFWGL